MSEPRARINTSTPRKKRRVGWERRFGFPALITPLRFVLVGLILGRILGGSVRNGVWVPTNATTKGANASAGDLDAWPEAVAEVVRGMNIVFGSFITNFG